MADTALQAYRNLDVDETGVLVFAGPVQIFGWYIYNNAATTRYIKLYNKATAPTVGTNTPVITLGLPAGAAANLMITGSYGIDEFPLGLGVGATTGVADADTGAPGTNDVVMNLWTT